MERWKYSPIILDLGTGLDRNGHLEAVAALTPGIESPVTIG
jgi:hypothetical protein